MLGSVAGRCCRLVSHFEHVRKPRNVDLARAQKHAGRHPETGAVRRDDNVRVVRAVDVLVRAAYKNRASRKRAM